MRITEPGLRDRISEAIGDPDSARILHVIRVSPRNAQSISDETGIPLSSVYRKLAVLRGTGLAFVKSFQITPEGKRQENYLSAVTEFRVVVSGDQVEFELIPSDESAHRLWFKLFNS